MCKENRQEWIDIAKGLGMLLVVLGHSVAFGSKVHNLIFEFHMPFFFLLSGLVYRKDKIQLIIRKRFNSLLRPYICFCVLGIGLMFIVGPKVSWKQVFIDLYFGNPEHIWVSSVWFLIALFITTVLFSVVLKIKSTYAQYMTVFFLFVTGVIYGKFYHVGIIKHRMPLEIDVAMVALFFFSLGYYGKKYLSDFLNICREKSHVGGILLCGIAVIFMLLSYLNHRVNLRSMEYGNAILFVGTALLGSLALMLSCQVLINGFVKKALIWVGKNNIYFLGAQAIGVRAFIKILNIAIGTKYELYSLPYGYAIICFLFTCLFSLLFTLGAQKTKNILEKI